MATYSLVWAPVLVDAVCDALVFHGEAPSGDIARTADQPHDQVVGVLESLRDAGYTRQTEGGRWMLTQAGRAEVRDELVKGRARIAELEAAIAAPIRRAPTPPFPAEWPDLAGPWLWSDAEPRPAPPVCSTKLVIGGAEHSLSITGTGDVIVALDGIPVIIFDVVDDEPPAAPLTRMERARRLYTRFKHGRRRSGRIFIG